MLSIFLSLIETSPLLLLSIGEGGGGWFYVYKSTRNTATNLSFLLLVSITYVEVPQKGANDPDMTYKVMKTILIGASA